jgi:hypothetical protein
LRRSLLTALALIPFVAAALFLGPVSAQEPAGLTKPVPWAQAPRTPDGKPDLQGVYNAATLTPVERPDNVNGRLFLTDEEARRITFGELDRVENRAQPSSPERAAPTLGGNVGGYNNFWIDRGSRVVQIDGKWRSSLIVDPADGKVPPQIEAARKRNATARGTAVQPTSDQGEQVQTQGQGAFDNVELRPLGERCILGFGSTSGPPTMPNYFYNNLKQIVQTPDYVMILVEMVHDARIIRMNPNAKHPPQHIQRWMGDSIGRWEGDTLVVETTNFTNKTRFRGSSEKMKVTERITRTDRNTILYQFTVDDPSTWERPWSGEYTWIATTEPIYEYACHEANYAMQGILKGERLLDAERAKSQTR